MYKKYTNTQDGDIASLGSVDSRKQLSLKNDSIDIELMKIKEIKGKSKKLPYLTDFKPPDWFQGGEGLKIR